MKALEIYIHILSGMRILIVEINNKDIPIYRREFIIWLGLIYKYTQFVLTTENVYSTVEYYVHAISTVWLEIDDQFFFQSIFLKYYSING